MSEAQDIGMGWVAALDAGSQRTYYANTLTVRALLCFADVRLALVALTILSMCPSMCQMRFPPRKFEPLLINLFSTASYYATSLAYAGCDAVGVPS